MKKHRIIALLIVLITCITSVQVSASAYDVRSVRPPVSATKIVYGYSGEGRELAAYKFGSGGNVLVAGFGIYGYNDAFARDGSCFVYTADQLMQLLDQNRQLITDYGWTVYVLPCMNPDGLIGGYTRDGPGRCTTTYLDENDALIHGTGVDLNRCFPVHWMRFFSERNFNGPEPLSAVEARALAQFVQDVKGKQCNICLDVQGWTAQTATSTGREDVLFQTFAERFPENTYEDCSTGVGYFTAYAASLGYQSCLFSFPAGIDSLDDFRRSGFCESFSGSVLDLMKACGVYNGHSLSCSSKDFTDVIPWFWYHDSVDFVLEHGIFRGESSTRFAPDVTMNRAMLVTTLWRMSQQRSARSEKPAMEDGGSGEKIFSDVLPDAWYTEAVTWAAENGIVNGYPDGTFRPMSPLTREQMATLFFRYAGWCGNDVPTDTEQFSFPDESDVSGYAAEPMRWACGIGLIRGVASGDQTLLKPKGTATRAQAATIIMRYLAASEHSD